MDHDETPAVELVTAPQPCSSATPARASARASSRARGASVPRWVAPTVIGLHGALVLVFFGLTAVVGADALWGVALGRWSLAHGAVPTGIPFAAAPTSDRPTPVLLGALVLTAAQSLGDHGLVGLLLALDAAVLAVLVLRLRHSGQSLVTVLWVATLVAIGGATSFGVARLPMLSLVPFVLLVSMLAWQARQPTPRLWWTIPLLVLWANLHGGFLVGLAVLGAFLIGHEVWHRPGRALAVGLAALATPLATPATWHVGAYLRDVFGNEAARRGSDLWARPSLTSGFDLTMILVAVVLGLWWARHRPPFWQWLIVVPLAVGTAGGVRNGIWLILAMALLGARPGRGPTGFSAGAARGSTASRLVAGLVVLGWVAASAVAVGRGTNSAPAGAAEAAAIVARAHGRVLLAPEPLLETLAADGARVWVCNPIDSFARADQATFLDFLAGTLPDPSALAPVEVIVAPQASPQGRLARAAGLHRATSIGPYAVWER